MPSKRRAPVPKTAVTGLENATLADSPSLDAAQPPAPAENEGKSEVPKLTGDTCSELQEILSQHKILQNALEDIQVVYSAEARALAKMREQWSLSAEDEGVIKDLRRECEHLEAIVGVLVREREELRRSVPELVSRQGSPTLSAQQELAKAQNELDNLRAKLRAATKKKGPGIEKLQAELETKSKEVAALEKKASDEKLAAQSSEGIDCASCSNPCRSTDVHCPSCGLKLRREQIQDDYMNSFQEKAKHRNSCAIIIQTAFKEKKERLRDAAASRYNERDAKCLGLSRALVVASAQCDELQKELRRLQAELGVTPAEPPTGESETSTQGLGKKKVDGEFATYMLLDSLVPQNTNRNVVSNLVSLQAALDLQLQRSVGMKRAALF